MDAMYMGLTFSNDLSSQNIATMTNNAISSVYEMPYELGWSSLSQMRHEAGSTHSFLQNYQRFRRSALRRYP